MNFTNLNRDSGQNTRMNGESTVPFTRCGGNTRGCSAASSHLNLKCGHGLSMPMLLRFSSAVLHSRGVARGIGGYECNLSRYAALAEWFEGSGSSFFRQRMEGKNEGAVPVFLAGRVRI